MASQTLKNLFPVIDALQSSNWDRSQFERLAAAGLDAVHVTLVYWENCRQTLDHVGQWNRWFKEHDDLILPVRSVSDIDQAHKSGRTGIILGFQNSSPIEDDLALVEIFHDLGVRVMQLTYNNHSLIGAGCYEKSDGGVTRFGRNVIAEMNRLGMIVDLSHTAEKTSLEAIEISSRPVAITHANPTFFHPAVRNKSSDLLKALAANEGMLGFSIYPLHLRGGSDCRLEDFCRMVAETAELMGIDRVGIGSDLCLNWGPDKLNYMRSGQWTFDADPGEAKSADAGWPDYAEWFSEPNDLANVALGLSRAGFSDDERDKVLGRNWFRFFERGFESG